jgi:hypothetical protein
MASLLEIDRVPLTLIAATTPDRAELLARRMRDAVARSLPSALAAACGATLDNGDAYVFVERLHVECAVAAEWSDDGIGRALAQEIARSLTRATGPGVVAFQDREEYVAAFVANLADGPAFSRWWFDEFRGLAMLPVSAALRTLMIDEGEVGLRSLARLTGDARRRVLAALSPNDAQQLLQHVLVLRRSSRAAPGVATLWRILDAAPASAFHTAAHRRLWWIVAAEREQPQSGSPVCLDRLTWLDAIREGLRRGAAPVLMASDEPGGALVAWSAALGLDFSVVASLSEGDRLAIVERLRAEAPAISDGTPDASSSTTFLFTAHGGVVLLCALVAKLGWWARWRDASLEAGREADEATESAAQQALAVVAHALAAERAGAITSDAAVRQLFGVTGTTRLRRGRVRRYAGALLRELAARLPGCDGSSPRYLRAQCLTLPAGLAFAADRIEARLGRAPLDVLLTLSSFKRSSVPLPDGRTLVIVPEGTP